MPVGWMPEKMTLGGCRINGFNFGDADELQRTWEATWRGVAMARRKAWVWWENIAAFGTSGV
jgi:hypothetical protein